MAERLGFGSDARLVIVHVDNVGLCHAQNVGFFEVHEAGMATSGSLLVPSSWFPEVVKYARPRTGLDLGVHLTLNSEFASYRWRPLLAPDRVRSLVDEDGYFWPSMPDTLSRADPDEAYRELRAQVERALRSGIDVTHLDAHLGTVMMRELLPVYLRLGKEFRVPVLFPKPTPSLLDDVGRPELLGALQETLENLGVADALFIDHIELRSLSFDPQIAAEHFRRIIGEIPAGVTHFLINPARADEELEAITPDSWLQRDAERRIFSSAVARRWFEVEGIQRIGYRDLRGLLRGERRTTAVVVE